MAGGRVAAVAGSNLNPELYYFGAAGGGVWKTRNGGLTWQNVWPQRAVNAIGAVTIDPHDDRTVWVGTGEPNLRNDISYGDGVWVTHDGGTTWHHVGLRRTWAIARIVVDPKDSRRVWVAAVGNPYRDSTARGVYRTDDGGRTWQHVLYVGPASGASDLAIDPRDPRVVYAGIWQFRRRPWTFTSGGPRDGIYASTDGGTHWHALRGHGLPRRMGRIGLAVAPSLPSRIYADIQSRAGVAFRSDDSGKHWYVISRDTLVNQRPFYMSRLEVDPADPNRVFFSSEDLIETDDGGKTYHDVLTAVHQDHHGLWISRDGKRIIEANDGGAPISIDGGKTWDWRYNVTIAQVYHVGYDRENPYHVCGGIQDNDTYCGPSNSLSPLGIENGDWRDVGNDGDGSWAWPEPGRPDAIWNVGVNELNGQLGIYSRRSRQNEDITPDDTDTNGRSIAGLPYRSNWEAPIVFSHVDPHRAYYGANVVFETTDRGRTWKAISPDLTRNDPRKQRVAGGPINTDASGAEFYDTIFDIAPSRLDDDVIWVGTDDGLVQRTADGGKTWHNVTPAGVAPWGRIDTVEASHVSDARAYVAIDRHVMGDPRPYVYVTDDAGRHWRKIVRGLPRDQYVHVVREDPKNPNVLYAGLEQGVWISLDRGADWQPLQLNLPPSGVVDMRVQPDRDDLLLATHGRGFWILDDLAPLEGLARAAAAAQPTFFAPRTAYTWYYWWRDYYGSEPTECCEPNGFFAGANPPFGALLSYFLPRAAAVDIVVDDAAGAEVACLQHAPGAAGIDRTAWDLTAAPPVPWKIARAWNRGGSGPTVVPGRYTLRLTAGGVTRVRTLDVRADPRARWSQRDLVARYRFVASLDGELSSIDVALNRLDALRRTATPALRAQIAAVYAGFTSDPINPEDDMYRPDRVRERLQTLLGVIALSQAPPLPPHEREAAAIRREYARAMRAYHAFLARNHLAPDPAPPLACTQPENA